MTAATAENVKGSLNRRMDVEVDRLETLLSTIDVGDSVAREEEAMRLQVERAREAAQAAEQSQLKAVGVLDRLSALERRLDEVRENEEMSRWLGISGELQPKAMELEEEEEEEEEEYDEYHQADGQNDDGDYRYGADEEAVDMLLEEEEEEEEDEGEVVAVGESGREEDERDRVPPSHVVDVENVEEAVVEGREEESHTGARRSGEHRGESGTTGPVEEAGSTTAAMEMDGVSGRSSSKVTTRPSTAPVPAPSSARPPSAPVLGGTPGTYSKATTEISGGAGPARYGGGGGGKVGGGTGQRKSRTASSRRTTSAVPKRRDSAGSYGSVNSGHGNGGNGGGSTAYHVISFDAKAEASIREVKEKVDAFELGQRKLHAHVNRMSLRMDDVVAQHERYGRNARSRAEEAEARTAAAWAQIERLEAAIESKADSFALEEAVERARRASEDAIATAEMERLAAHASKYAGSTTVSCISCAAPLEPPGVGLNAPPPPQSLPMMSSAEFSSGGVSRVALLPNTHSNKTNMTNSGSGSVVNTPNGGGFFSPASRSPYASKSRSPMSARASVGGGGGGKPKSGTRHSSPSQKLGRSGIASAPGSWGAMPATPNGGSFGVKIRHQSHPQNVASYSSMQAVDSEFAVEFPPSQQQSYGGVAASPPSAPVTSGGSIPVAMTPSPAGAALPTTFYGVPPAARPSTSGDVASALRSPLDGGNLTISQTLLNGDLPRGGGGGGYAANARPRTSGGMTPVGGSGAVGVRGQRGVRQSGGGPGFGVSPSRQSVEHVWGGM